MFWTGYLQLLRLGRQCPLMYDIMVTLHINQRVRFTHGGIWHFKFLYSVILQLDTLLRRNWSARHLAISTRTKLMFHPLSYVTNERLPT